MHCEPWRNVLVASVVTLAESTKLEINPRNRLTYLDALEISFKIDLTRE